jgi:DNA-binding MarR family transcriptional regulator
MKTRLALTNFIDDVIYQMVLTHRYLTDVNDLSDSEYKVLWFIYKNPKANMSQIAKFGDISLPRASKIVDGLVNHNYVERVSGNDRRKTAIELTSKGNKIINQTILSHQEISESILSPLDPEERNALFNLLNKCNTLS